MKIKQISEEITKALGDATLQLGLKRAVINTVTATNSALSGYPSLIELAKYVKDTKKKVLDNIEFYIDQTIKNLKAVRAHAYLANSREKALEIIDKIIGERRLIVKSKSMTSEEMMLRQHLINKGCEVYETDLGELLIQIAKEKPMHVVAPAVHMTKERAALLLKKLGLPVTEEMKHEELVFQVRKFFREKFAKAAVGIAGANAIAADTGAIFLVHNEGNISCVATLPEILIVVAGVEKIMPTFTDAIYQVMVQSGYAGLYPPTYVNVFAGPSSTADIEYHRVYGVHGPRELHVILLLDKPRINALSDPILKNFLRCVRCGRCQIVCPIWSFCGNIWGGRTYGGPMGVGWTAISDGIENAEPLSWFCLLCKTCEEACPVEIDVSETSRFFRSKSIEKGEVPAKTGDLLEKCKKYGNPFGLPRSRRSHWANAEVPLYKPGFELLYYVGDLGSYETRAQGAAKALAKILSATRVSFGFLGADENCSGSEAYELGEEGLLEEIASSNIQLFKKLDVKKIVTLSPHSYNVIKNCYKKFGGSDLDVKHYTQLLWEFIKEGKLKFQNRKRSLVITYHDPCFLGRWNGEYEAPRSILKSLPGVKVVEMEKNRQNALCCGGGSGNCYTGFGCGLIPENENTPSRVRVREAYETGAEILAVACPGCLVMLDDAVKAENLEDKLTVKDLAEIVVSMLE